MRRVADLPGLLPIAAGFALWSLAFVVLYGGQALGCRLGWELIQVLPGVSLQRLVLVGLFLVLSGTAALLALRLHAVFGQRRADREPHAFLGRIARDGGVAAAGAVLVSFAGVFWLSPC